MTDYFASDTIEDFARQAPRLYALLMILVRNYATFDLIDGLLN